MKKIVASPVFWLVVLSLLPLTSLVQPGIINAHDAPDHVARIANFYQSLAEGNVVPRWAAHLNWGYGHPILMFLYPLPSYIASVFHFLGFSFVDSTKLVFALSWVASALTMYIWMKCAFGKKAAIFGSLLYIFAPYRFVDFYVRGALGEHVAFIFPPLVLYFLFSVSKERWCNRRWIGSVIGATISLSALILAHNAIAIMFLPIVMIYMAYLFWFEAKPKWPLIVAYFLTLFFCFGLTAFFWIPAYFEGKYTLRDIVTASEALQRFVSWRWFVYSPWNYGGGDEITKSLGFVQWFGILGSFVILWKSNDRKIRIVLIGSLLILIGSLFIMTSSSALIWKNFSLLQKFQFPWRFLSVSVFTAAIIGGVAIDRMLEKLKNRNILFIIICGLIVLITVPQWHPKG
ncbi:hypothetical protein A2Z00_02540 [Candidatus Gottesmanbacteria bacterium RBG_13_45_10]|uniref:Membrane protein 6-pyruvoyl-tetrahydropterin synthase-related domain-containing protein n=1 Tax=Candidatus Gottesmanbacteria bacterium RBG_13_45_10 TaxID=1798370 RepID=A0A1F5ZFW5_9BACT|nr:MAG: hypothetical protein A2Z00_02540 [Candidatus Gottesmanbacteria bacterium RBG_13_45_10]